jgi:L-ascorbate metabolism protein UlaG (beta-lactamase superfamily)
MFKAFGRSPKRKFFNIEPTEVMRKDASYIGLIRQQFSKPDDVSPKNPVASIKTDLRALAQNSGDTPEVVWFGHSAYLIAQKGKTMLVDPVFENASPVSFIGKPFAGSGIYHAEDMPDIDLLIITHDHYDHLEYKTLMRLKGKIKSIVCPAGVDSHLTYWGFDAHIISSLEWNEETALPIMGANVKVTALPARHFSGRGITRNKTLWNSYALQLEGFKIFIGGDSGYGEHFKTIGEQHGPFDIAFIECGQYGKDWPNIHMLPEETARVALEIKAKILFPVHWAKFVLALHPWNEPIKRLLKAAEQMPYIVVSPKIGEPYTFGKDFIQQEWWNS